ncbi:chromate transporter [Oryzomicrobium terrae]|uniref:Chromate transporter n=1 Tax=Oryzomicrobium terrae TaxID=1735038 RepID=A0A5C1EAL6_9RHOO|nr:chromate efflux transporter [Oryzomicrobium terrae]QEL66021.1 chromate transporter [Oryzomicrobium terrae]
MPNSPAVPAPPAPPRTVSFAEAFRFWLKLGFISFGGPAGQIAVMHQELVEKRRWISEGRFLHALNYCMVLPGPEAQQLATYIGWLMHRTWGGIVAGALFVLPSLLILIGLSWLYVAQGHTPLVAGLFYGIKPAVTAIVLQAAHRIGGRALKQPYQWAIAAAAFAAIFAFNTPFPLIVAAAALTGYLVQRFTTPAPATAPGHATTTAASPHQACLIDDDTPPPAHARFRWSRLAAVAGIGALLWLVPMGLLAVLGGWRAPLTQMGWFFTKAALLTFGGAYAVLPYVFQGAVTHYGWLSPGQMIDGLALGETTPGPLIMVVAFVGFVGGYGHADATLAMAGGSPLLAGMLAATVVTWFTFLPSFLFILAGGPLVESTHGNLSFTAPLSAITAAVVGVIVNLALFFAYHVFWPTGFPRGWASLATPDWPSLAIAGLAAVALFRFKIGVAQVIGGCALLGLAIRAWLS